MTKKFWENYHLTIFWGAALIILFGLLLFRLTKSNRREESQPAVSRVSVTTSPSPTPALTPSPSPRPLTFAEMNALYGPCAYLPTLMFHHVQDWQIAKKKGQTGLTVETEMFKKQMQYLKDKNYQVVSMQNLISFFDAGTPISPKSILLTFDDAYADFYLNAYPVLREFNFKATVFTPTGLINNPEYLYWDKIGEMNASGHVYFANHTWSHKNVNSNPTLVEGEITRADIQLTEHSLNTAKIFAYPYGSENSNAKAVLGKLGYRLAFTTQPGSILCKAKRFDLPRVRVGNRELSVHGL